MGQVINKGETFNLNTDNAGLNEIQVGFSWTINNYKPGTEFDVDASAFLADANGLCASVDDIIFYGAMEHPSGAVKHCGDDADGDTGTDDNEAINIKLAELPNGVDKIGLTFTIYEAINRKQEFGQIGNIYIRVIDLNTKVELVRYELKDNYTGQTAILAAELDRIEGEWVFHAIGQVSNQGLASLCELYGLPADAEE